MLISKFINGNVEDSIAELESAYNMRLPKEYRNFLCKYNGGYTPKTKFKIGKTASDIRGFYGVGHVKLSLNTIELKEWITSGVFPIACDSFGNHIVIELGNGREGSIYFCNHEKKNKKEFLAENLKDFLSYCHSEEISAASRRSIKEREEALIAKGRANVITEALRQMWQAEIDKYENMIQEEVRLDEI